MLHIDPKMPATVLTLSRSKTVTTHVRDTNLKEAVRFVMERLPKVERSGFRFIFQLRQFALDSTAQICRRSACLSAPFGWSHDPSRQQSLIV
jgi:hypothetical protein